MSNKEIAAQFKLLAQLMELHGENSFKMKAYRTAAFRIEKLSFPLKDQPEAIADVPGIGSAIAEKVSAILETGRLPLLEEYMVKTPEGVREMLGLKGIGPKKIALLWKELGIENLGELAYACQENRLLSLKGFGAKTQAGILASIEFLQSNKDWFLFYDAELQAEVLSQDLQRRFPGELLVATGAFRRQMPVLNKLEWVTSIDPFQLQDFLQKKLDAPGSMKEDQLEFEPLGMLKLVFYFSQPSNFTSRLFVSTASEDFRAAFEARYKLPDLPEREEGIFEANGLTYIPPFLRDYAGILEMAAENAVPTALDVSDIKGVIHAHSTYSDGVDSLEDMARYAQEKGYEYLVISDHSRSAFYANGLQAENILQQHEEIKSLNRQLAPFKIFRSIESDILNDGSLDYPEEILASFDLVIASIHSNLKMTQEKAMERLLKAVENPYTRILGHPTGRLLLSRNGYPIDTEALIRSCATHKVVIEINAHPRRLDLDWQFIPRALEAGVMMSVDPDAHSRGGIDLVRYGVLAAQKGGLPASRNLSSKSLTEFEAWLGEKRAP